MNGDYSVTSADSLIASAWNIPSGCYDYTNNIYNWTTANMLTTITDGSINVANNTPDELKINIKKNKVELNFKL